MSEQNQIPEQNQNEIPTVLSPHQNEPTAEATNL